LEETRGNPVVGENSVKGKRKTGDWKKGKASGPRISSGRVANREGQKLVNSTGTKSSG